MLSHIIVIKLSYNLILSENGCFILSPLTFCSCPPIRFSIYCIALYVIICCPTPPIRQNVASHFVIYLQKGYKFQSTCCQSICYTRIRFSIIIFPRSIDLCVNHNYAYFVCHMCVLIVVAVGLVLTFCGDHQVGMTENFFAKQRDMSFRCNYPR